MSVTGAPSHVNSTFLPAQLGGATSLMSTLHLTATDGTVGVYPITISATDGNISSSLGVTLTTLVQPTVTPQYPLTETANLSPTFSWSATAITTHTVEIATDSSFNNIVASSGALTGTTYTPTISLSIGSTYYWRVSSSNACGAVVSSTASFERKDPFTFKHYLPIIVNN